MDEKSSEEFIREQVFRVLARPFDRLRVDEFA